MNDSGTQQAASLLKLSEVERQTALKKSSLYAAIKAGTFPAPVRLSARAVAWRSTDVAKWIASLPSTSTEPSNG